jgi:hypothetical protein
MGKRGNWLTLLRTLPVSIEERYVKQGNLHYRAPVLIDQRRVVLCKGYSNPPDNFFREKANNEIRALVDPAGIEPATLPTKVGML